MAYLAAGPDCADGTGLHLLGPVKTGLYLVGFSPLYDLLCTAGITFYIL